jgi:hypothetical protein
MARSCPRKGERSPGEWRGELLCIPIMGRNFARRFFVLLLSVALTAGVALHCAPAMEMSANTAVAVTVGTDMPMPSKCGGCGGDEKTMRSAACYAYCGSVLPLPVVPVVFESIAYHVVGPSSEPVATGHTAPPDPYPPRPVGLS